jgi:outer membrane protein TolC
MISLLHSPREDSIDGDCPRQPHLRLNGMGIAQIAQSDAATARSNRNLKRTLTVLLATGFSIALAVHAQRADTTLPNAPAPVTARFQSSQNDSAAKVEMASLQAPAASSAAAESAPGDVSLYTVVDLALRNSRTVRMAEADQQKARGIANETHDIYIPSFSVGSGLGYSYGFPLGNPTLFNVQSQFLLFSFSQKDYIRSARAGLKAATLSLQDARRQVILDASLNYIELNKMLTEIQALQQALANTDTLVSVVQDRLNAGLESKMNLTQAQLTRAQIRLQQIHLEDHADDLRKHLSGLTGLDAGTITPVASSVPALPELDFQGLISKEDQSPAVQSAFTSADARMYGAKGDEKQNNRPIVFGAFQYARFASFNGYSQYYLHFVPNNVGIGINATWPLFDRIKHDKAVESAAQAKHDRQQAELAKIQNDEGNLTLWHSLRELEAQAQVADLQQQLAQDTLASTLTQMNQGAANGQPVPPQQADQYRVEERTRYVALEDAQFNVTRVKLNLLSAVGDLEDWAKESVESQGASAATVAPTSPH